jgi:hypothetical protein
MPSTGTSTSRLLSPPPHVGKVPFPRGLTALVAGRAVERPGVSQPPPPKYSKTKHTYLAAQYRRIAARRGKKRALIAVGHTVLTIVYTMLTRQQPYQDLGAAYFDQRERHRVERRLVQRLERLGYEVALQPKALAS